MGVVTAFGVAGLIVSVPAFASSSPAKKRDAALHRVQACADAHNPSSRQCRNLGASIEVLQQTYRQGDKTILPLLFQVISPGEFYGDALIADPQGFLTMLNASPEKNQQAICNVLAGGPFGLANKERFEGIRKSLRETSQTEPTLSTASLCLKVIEEPNAVFLVSYFPPGTFTGRAGGEAALRMYTAGMFALSERPLWPVSIENRSHYRLTILSSFGNATVVTLNLLADGSGEIAIRSVDRNKELVTDDRTAAITNENTVRFLNFLDQASFWQTPVELTPEPGVISFDGAAWILEGVKDGSYHVAVRQSPDYRPQNADEARFADAGKLLLELADHHLGHTN